MFFLSLRTAFWCTVCALAAPGLSAAAEPAAKTQFVSAPIKLPGDADSPWLRLARLPLAASAALEKPERALASLLDHAQVQLSAEFLGAFVCRSLEQELPVRDVILGVPFTGSARAVGRTRLELVVDERRAVFDVLLTGTANSRTVGAAGPASIHCDAVTTFLARRRFYLDDGGLTADSTVCQATTHSTITGVTTSATGLRGRLVRRIALRRAHEDLAVADRIAGRHSERDIAASFNAQTEPVLQMANSVLHGPRLRGLIAGGTGARRLCCSTSSDYLHLAAAADAGRASPAPPAPRRGTSAVVWLPAAEVELSKLIAAAGPFIGRDWTRLPAEFGIGQLPPTGGRKGEAAFAPAAPPAMSVSVEIDHEWLAVTMRPQRTAGDFDAGRGGQ